MEIYYGNSGLGASWQSPFPETVECEKCGGDCRPMFTGMETKGPHICNLHENQPDEAGWPHDAIACTVYLCKKCYHGQVEWNQA